MTKREVGKVKGSEMEGEKWRQVAEREKRTKIENE